MFKIQILPEKAKLLLLMVKEGEKLVSFFFFSKIGPLSISESEDLSFILCIVIIFFILPFFLRVLVLYRILALYFSH